jgi:hypothetical protein
MNLTTFFSVSSRALQSKMLEAAAPQRIPSVMRKAKKRVCSTRHQTSHNLEPPSSESGCEIVPVTAAR